MLTEDNSLGIHNVMDCGVGELVGGIAPVPSPLTLAPSGPRGPGGAARSDCPCARGNSPPSGKTALQVGRLSKPCQSGSTLNFEHAYRMYNRRVYAKCLHMVGDEADAEDLTQEVFLQVFRKMDLCT
ncbi:MAG: RNA polymerase sigma factor [Terriglobia bacterium]